MSDTYAVKMNCPNCKIGFPVSIPKGQTIKEYLASAPSKCANCGCLGLRITAIRSTKAKGVSL